MNKILIYHHLGLGDHIICHGIVRNLCSQYDHVDLFCKQHNQNTVRCMYADISNLQLIICDDHGARCFIDKHSGQYDKIMEITANANEHKTFDQVFYDKALTPFQDRWESFSLPNTCYQMSQEAYQKTNLQANSYVFIHDDTHRQISDRLITPHKQKFRDSNIHTFSITDYLHIIQNASEIHVIDSCFMLLIDSVEYNAPNQKLYRHRYARPDPSWLVPVVRKNWHNIWQ